MTEAERLERERLATKMDAEAAAEERDARSWSREDDDELAENAAESATEYRAIAALLRAPAAAGEPVDLRDDWQGQQAGAWLAVCALMDDLKIPRYNGSTGKEGVLLAIQKLHEASQ